MGATAKAVDFSGVKERGSFSPKRVPAGDYAAKIVKVEDAESKKTGEFQYLFTFKIEKFSQASYPYYCQLTENQLWKLRNLAVAAGLTVPKKRMKFDPNKVINKSVGITLEDDEYEGKEKSVIAAVFPLSELADAPDAEYDESDDDEGDAAPQVAGSDDDDEVDEAPKAKKKDKAGKKKKKKDAEEMDISDVD